MLKPPLEFAVFLMTCLTMRTAQAQTSSEDSLRLVRAVGTDIGSAARDRIIWVPNSIFLIGQSVEHIETPWKLPHASFAEQRLLEGFRIAANAKLLVSYDSLPAEIVEAGKAAIAVLGKIDLSAHPATAYVEIQTVPRKTERFYSRATYRFFWDHDKPCAVRRELVSQVLLIADPPH